MAHSLIGVIHIAAKRYAAVLEACDAALQIDPTNDAALLNSAIVLGRLGRSSLALGRYQQLAHSS
jgi:lipoprotein NlpI